MDVTLVFEKGGDKNFSCFIEEDTGKCGFIGYGPTARIAEEDIEVERKEYMEMGEDVPSFNVVRKKFDIGAFFDYFPINVTQFAKFAGINASQLRQYASCQRNPSKKTKENIENAIRSLGKILMDESYAIGID